MRAPAVPYLETAAAAVWWTVGAAALDGGLSTAVLAVGLGVTGAVVVALRRRFGAGEPLAPGRRARLLRLLIGAVAVIVAIAVGLGYLGYAELTVPLACAVVGVTLLMLSPVLEDRAPLAAGSLLMVLGAAGAVLALQSAGQLFPHGVVGLGAGALLWAFGAQRTGLLAEARDRARR
jgi:hypothetical protein